MPWTVNENDEYIYEPSIYAKEELPTWDEVYNEFFLGKYYWEHPTDAKANDNMPYWKIPKYKYLLATVCNQFNKMIFEDEYFKQVKNTLASWDILVDDRRESAIVGIIFTCDPFTGDEDLPHYESTAAPPPIYTIPHPQGWVNPFWSEYARADITKFTNPLVFRAILDIDTNEVTDARFRGQNETLYDTYEHSYPDIFSALMKVMMAPFENYFSILKPMPTKYNRDTDPAI